jgi:hypothetical protein
VALDAVAVDVGNVPRVATLAAIKAIKRVADIEAAKVSGGDGRLSGFGRRGKLRTRDDFDFDAASAEATVFAIPPGMWAIVESGASAHVIGFGRSRAGGNYRPGRGGSKRLRMPGSGSGWRTGPVFHPGSRPKRAWTKVRKRSRPLVLKIFEKELREALHG